MTILSLELLCWDCHINYSTVVLTYWYFRIASEQGDGNEGFSSADEHYDGGYRAEIASKDDWSSFPSFSLAKRTIGCLV